MPHTKRQIQAFLNKADLSPRRLWGQHFLIDLNLMRMLVEAAQLKGNETVLEVGCGTGSLTDLLAEKAGRVIAVEIDLNLMQIAREQLARHKNIQFIGADVLSGKNTINQEVCDTIAKAQKQHEGPFYLVANLPYQAAAPLMIDLLLEEALVPEGMWVTVQKEVADRMTADRGTKAYGPLSILLQVTGRMKQLRTIKPQAFWPRPKVNSALVSWRRDEKKCKNIRDIKRVKQMVDLLLRHRRKKIGNCLTKEAGFDEIGSLLEPLGIDAEARGETLGPEAFVALANRWAK